MFGQIYSNIAKKNILCTLKIYVITRFQHNKKKITSEHINIFVRVNIKKKMYEYMHNTKGIKYVKE